MEACVRPELFRLLPEQLEASPAMEVSSHPIKTWQSRYKATQPTKLFPCAFIHWRAARPGGSRKNHKTFSLSPFMCRLYRNVFRLAFPLFSLALCRCHCSLIHWRSATSSFGFALVCVIHVKMPWQSHYWINFSDCHALFKNLSDSFLFEGNPRRIFNQAAGCKPKTTDTSAPTG